MSLPNPFDLMRETSNSRASFFNVRPDLENSSQTISKLSSLQSYGNEPEDGEILSDEEKDDHCSSKMNRMEGVEEEGDEEEPVIDPKLCAICQENGPKYKCPCCSLRTCSASCVQAHKTVYNCSGRTAPATFKKLSNINEADLRHGKCIFLLFI